MVPTRQEMAFLSLPTRSVAHARLGGGLGSAPHTAMRCGTAAIGQSRAATIHPRRARKSNPLLMNHGRKVALLATRNKFRDLGFIEYNGDLKVNTSLLSVVLDD